MAKVEEGSLTPKPPRVSLASPFVSTMPLAKPSGTMAPELNVPLALPAHVKVGLMIVIPEPTSVLASIAAVLLALTVNWAVTAPGIMHIAKHAHSNL